MTPLDVISLDDAKAYLVVDFDDRDSEIERLIATAIGLVEQYTCYRLCEREETFVTYECKTDLSVYPVTIDSVVNEDDEVVTYTERSYPLSLVLSAPKNSTVVMTVGYADTSLIPAPLIAACYKVITYLFENKDVYSVGLPVDVQMMINQFRRSPTI